MNKFDYNKKFIYIERVYITFLLSVLSLFLHCGMAQSYFFKQISIQEGLSQSTVRSILCDSKQTLWIGTRNGLNRFDGYEIKNYFKKNGDTSSIPGNNILFLFEDTQEKLWIGTQAGICQYIPQKDNFKTILINGTPIYSRCCTAKKDCVIFIGNGCLYKYQFSTEEFSKLSFIGEGKDQYFTLCQSWNDNTLLIAGSHTNVYKVDLRTGRLDPFGENLSKRTFGLLVENEHKIWVAQYNKGVYLLNHEGKITAQYTTRNSALKNNIILDLLLKENQLWMATDGGGINILNTENGDISSLEHTPGELNTLPVNSITCLYEDKESNIWAGSVRGGHSEYKMYT